MSGIFIPPNIEKLEGHIAFDLSMHLLVTFFFSNFLMLHARVLKFHIHIFSCTSYVPLKTRFENLVARYLKKYLS